MNTPVFPRRAWTLFTVLGFILITAISAPAQQWVTETRDPKQAQDEDFAKAYTQWTGEARFGSRRFLRAGRRNTSTNSQGKPGGH